MIDLTRAIILVGGETPKNGDYYMVDPRRLYYYDDTEIINDVEYERWTTFSNISGIQEFSVYCTSYRGLMEEYAPYISSLWWYDKDVPGEERPRQYGICYVKHEEDIFLGEEICFFELPFTLYANMYSLETIDYSYPHDRFVDTLRLGLPSSSLVVPPERVPEFRYDLIMLEPGTYINYFHGELSGFNQLWYDYDMGFFILTNYQESGSTAEDITHTVTSDMIAGGCSYYDNRYDIPFGSDFRYIAQSDETNEVLIHVDPYLEGIYVVGGKRTFTVNEPFTFDGSVMAYYSNFTEINVAEDSSFTGYNTSVAGTQEVTVTYSEYDEYLPYYGIDGSIICTARYDISVNNPKDWVASIKDIEDITDTIQTNLRNVLDSSIFRCPTYSQIKSKGINVWFTESTHLDYTNDMLVRCDDLEFNDQPKPLEYVQDGLVFWLDGTDKRASGNNVWVDKIQNLGFHVLDSGVTDITNGFNFNGNGMLEGRALDAFANAGNCTIEVVVKSRLSSGGWSPIVTLNHWANGYLGADFTYAYSGVNTLLVRYSMYNVDNSNLYDASLANNNIATISLPGYNKSIYVNGSMVSTVLGQSSVGSNKNYAHIGGRVDGTNKVKFNGEIYSVRVYDRVLTDEEIINNQTLDMQLYGIN